MSRAWILAALTLALAGAAVAEPPLVADVVAVPAASPRPRPNADRVSLRLCDCQEATGPPGGLSCDKEGFFISTFQRQGQWVAGGGAVPLSHAVCCRPCVPDADDLPEGMDSDDPPVAVVSLGCHASTDPLGVRCEAEPANSFVSGFTDSVHVFSAVDTQYPVNSAQCCTPALLTAGGAAWELERCGCDATGDADRPVGCGGNATHALLSGYDFFRVSPLGQVVPIGPAKCCGVCLSGKVHPAPDCADLNRCSGNGVCALGRCECLAGWGSPDCSQALSGKGGWGRRIPPWAIALIVIGSSLLAVAVLAVAAHLAEIIYEAREAGGGAADADARAPLLLRIERDDAGSVGSEDTADLCDDDIEGVEQRIEDAVHRLEDGGGGGVGVAEGGNEGGEQPPGAATEGGDGGGEAGDVEAAAPRAPAGAGGSRGDVEAPAPADDAGDPQKPLQSYVGVGPLSGVDCVVCMTRPVQCAVIPCGHVCMCRRCSRRLARCPICRKDIARRQRLFV